VPLWARRKVQLLSWQAPNSDIAMQTAIYGQLAGAFYGVEEIPKEWRTKLALSQFILERADQLFALTSGTTQIGQSKLGFPRY
jgi:hypothetical protein